MKPTLNQADIDLLKETFATKGDLVAMEKRQDQKYATKDDLKDLVTVEDLNLKLSENNAPLWKKIEAKFEELEPIIAKSFQNHENRIQKLESEVGITSSN